EEVRLALPPPAEPVARDLHERLLAARASLRESLPPRSLTALRLQTAFVADPPTFVVDEVEWPHRAQVSLPLQPARPGEPVVATCSCGASRCHHALAALDTLLEIVADPRRRKEAAPILTELARPPWERALVDLDGGLAPEEGTARVVWRLAEGRELTIQPALQRQGKRGWSAGSKCQPIDIVHDPPDGALPADHEVAALLHVGGGRFVRRALRALVGHPRVTLAEAPF